MSRIKVIFIGNEAVHKFLQEHISYWDWQIPLPEIGDFQHALNNNLIDADNTQAIFMLDNLFDPTGKSDLFELCAFHYASHVMFSIISYNESLRGRIAEAITEKFDRHAQEEPPYYFIDKKNPLQNIDKAVRDTANNHPNPDIRATFSDGKNVVMADEPEPEEDEDYVGPRSFIESDEKLGKVISVTSSKGGSGKSTIAVSLGSYIARSSLISKRQGLEQKALKVAIVDFDVRDGQIGFLTGFQKPTILKLVLLDEMTKDNVQETAAIYSDSLKCDLYLAPKQPRSADDIAPQFFNELIQTLRAVYDYVILDTSVNYLDPLLEQVAYPSSDQIIFVTDLGVNSVFGMTRWIQEVTGMGSQSAGRGVSKNKIGVVVNKALNDVGMDIERIRHSSMGLPLLSVLPSLPKLVTAAANKQSLDLLTTNDEVNKSLRRLAASVVGKDYALSVVDKNL